MQVYTPITIRYGETDQMGVVYYGNYLLYFEDARTQFLEALGYPYTEIEKEGYVSPVMEVYVKYNESLHYGEKVIIRTRITKSLPTRTTFSYEVFREGEDYDTARPCCTGHSTHCLIDAKTLKPVSIKHATPRLYELYNQVVEPEEEDKN